MKARRFVIVLLSAALLVSAAVNVVALRTGQGFYRQLAEMHLDPLGLSYYPVGVDPLPALAPGRQRVVFFGDSRAAGWSAPAGLDRFQFVNRGIGNQTSAEVLHRLEAHVAPLHPDIVVVQVGVNDLKAISVLPEQRAALAANCQANIGQIVARCRDLGATVIVTTIFPLGPVPLERRLFWSGDVTEAIEQVNAGLASLAGERVLVLDSAAVLAGQGGITRPEYSTDMLHVSAQGYQALNTALGKVLAELEP